METEIPRLSAQIPILAPKIKWDTPDKVAWLIINRIIDQSGWPTATPEARDKAHDIVQQEIETFISKPSDCADRLTALR